MTLRKTIDTYFEAANYYHHIPYEFVAHDMINEESRIGIGLAVVCGVVEHASGGKNLFGREHGARAPYEPPYCEVQVTKDRVNRLLAHVEKEGTYEASNGVGLLLESYPPLIEEANRLGGAHLPRCQLRVGLARLHSLIKTHGLSRALAVYGGRPGDRNTIYADDVMHKIKRWRRVLQS